MSANRIDYFRYGRRHILTSKALLLFAVLFSLPPRDLPVELESIYLELGHLGRAVPASEEQSKGVFLVVLHSQRRADTAASSRATRP